MKGYILPMGFGVGGGPKRLRRGERGRKNEGGAFLRVSWKRERTSVVAEHGDNSPEGLSEVAHFAVAVRCANIFRQVFPKLLHFPGRVNVAEHPALLN